MRSCKVAGHERCDRGCSFYQLQIKCTERVDRVLISTRSTARCIYGAVGKNCIPDQDEDSDVVNCDQLSNAFEMVKMQDSIGMGFVDKNHVAFVNAECMTVRATVSYLMLDADQFQKSRAVRMPLNLAAPVGQAWPLPQIVSQVLHQVRQKMCWTTKTPDGQDLGAGCLCQCCTRLRACSRR